MDHTVIDAGDHRLSMGAISGAVGNDPYRLAPPIPLARRKTAVGASRSLPRVPAKVPLPNR
jgi:hypothetical protein